MHKGLIAVIAAICASGAVAQDWQPMTGAQISDTLTDQVLVYENATQKIFASGRTVYEASEPSWGSWAVRGDQYCSQWPPSDNWNCYSMTRLGPGVRFVDGFGNVTEGRLNSAGG